jgi:hypothetical protein
MGGLVARYYIEVLGGFTYTRALITFATPHGGSVDTIQYLANGYRKLGVQLSRLTAALRSLPSLYQLLPRYQAIRDTDGQWKRVFETAEEINHIDRTRAKEAYRFYLELDSHFQSNRKCDDYSVEILPTFGWGHETLQSAFVTSEGNVHVRMDLPPSVDRVFANGDETAPRVSAIPIHLNNKPLQWCPVNQRHATD